MKRGQLTAKRQKAGLKSTQWHTELGIQQRGMRERRRRGGWRKGAKGKVRERLKINAQFFMIKNLSH